MNQVAKTTPETKQWIGQRLHQLKHEGPGGLLAEFREIQKDHLDKKTVSGNLAYLEKRENQMQYPQFQAQGWPIGSGIIESGNKLVVEARLKGSGIHWAPDHVNSMLAIRNILCSDRWKEEWPKVAAQLRRQTAQKRQALHQDRFAAKTTSPQNMLPQPLPIADLHLEQMPAQPQTPTKIKPNPWRKFNFGRNLYRPSDPPKN